MSTATDSPSPPPPPLPPSAAADTLTREVQVTYDDRIVRRFILASGIWAAVGMLVGVFIALQLAFPDLNIAPWLSFGRLRPLHTNAVIFAFVGNMMFAGVYYSTQRLTKARTHDLLSKVHFWGWQLIIVAAAVTLPLGITQGKEYSELEWPIDIAVTLVWVVFAINFFYCLYKRREKHLYVALWFYISTIVTVAVLYIVNNIALPVFAGGIKSYSVYAGAQDALVQWWYGHNAVAFFLTTPILGIMYYFLPKAAGRPVYSYRLSIIHFWALVFLYIWAGPHHLLYTSLPDWAQSLGMIFSLMLWAPSWGGMINGLLTLRGAWHLLKTDPVIKFFVAGVTFYGMATFEGPLLSIKAVSALGHYTDWIIGHVHTGALGWNGLMAAGLIYWLVPRLFGTQLYSKRAADAHFWMATLGILLYAVSMWISGIEQGLMWRATKPSGVLAHDFLETTRTIWPMYVMRAVGGVLFLAGWGVLLWNVWKTVRSGRPTDVTVTATEAVRTTTTAPHWTRIVFAPPLMFAYIGLIVMGVYFATDIVGAAISFAFLVFTFIIGLLVVGKRDPRMGGETVHRVLEGRPLVMTLLVTAAILVGGIAELIPTLTINKAVPLTHAASTGEVQTPYTPLELQGRDIYVREGCYTCHSQQIRPFVWERQRYGPPSVAGESRFDHPFQWGSKRTGPDLAREGTHTGRDAVWHYVHMTDPRRYSEGSVMPSYQFLEDATIDVDDTAVKMSAMKTLGVPYKPEHIAGASQLVEIQGRRIAEKLAANGIGLPWDSELTAMIAYLLRLGNQPADPIAELLAADTSPPAGKLPGAPAAPEPTNHKATP